MPRCVIGSRLTECGSQHPHAGISPHGPVAPTAFPEATGITPTAAPTLQATATLPGAPTATQGTAQPSATLALPTAVPVTVEPSPTERGPLATQMPVLPTPGGEPVK